MGRLVLAPACISRGLGLGLCLGLGLGLAPDLDLPVERVVDLGSAAPEVGSAAPAAAHGAPTERPSSLA